MKKLKILTLLFMALLISYGCNKENLNGSVSAERKANNSDITAPLECKIGQIIDENGDMVNHTPAELTDDMYAEALTKTSQRYVIPVVFHIFGERQGNNDKIDIQRIKEVLDWINNDFHGVVNPGDPITINNVHSDRKPFIGTLPELEFKLARYNADGERQNGFIMYSTSHPANKSGLGNEPRTGNTEIAKIAWDNDMYMNVYITNDLYANGVTNNSGVAWYPDAAMTARNTARVVYNGAYLPKFLGTKATGSGPDFTSVISHEFGHFLNLAHTFNENGMEGVCDPNLPDGGAYGDHVADTPQMLCSANYPAYDSFTAKNCVGEIIDYGNFMNYGVYCNFTQGQISRIKTALEHISRKPLWNELNVIKTLGDDYDYIYPDVSLSFDNKVINAGDAGKLTVTVPSAQNIDIRVTITNPNQNILSIPETVTIPAGETTGSVSYTGLAGGSANLSFFGNNADVLTASTYITVNGEQPPTPTPTPDPTPTPEPDPNVQNILNNRTVIINSGNKIFPAISSETSVTIYTSRGDVVLNDKNYSGDFNMYNIPNGSYYYTIKDGTREYKGSIEIVK